MIQVGDIVYDHKNKSLAVVESIDRHCQWDDTLYGLDSDDEQCRTLNEIDTFATWAQCATAEQHRQKIQQFVEERWGEKRKGGC